MKNMHRILGSLALSGHEWMLGHWEDANEKEQVRAG